MGEHHTSVQGWMQTRVGRLEGGPTRESGVVLILSLLLLMVLTLLGVAALTKSRIELQLATNDRARKQALATADGALSIAETVIESWTDPAELDENAKADDGRYGVGEQPAWGYLKRDATCDGAPDACRGGSEALLLNDLPAGMAYVLSSPQTLLPRYAIERLPTVPDSYVSGVEYHGGRGKQPTFASLRSVSRRRASSAPNPRGSSCKAFMPSGSIDDRDAS